MLSPLGGPSEVIVKQLLDPVAGELLNRRYFDVLLVELN